MNFLNEFIVRTPLLSPDDKGNSQFPREAILLASIDLYQEWKRLEDGNYTNALKLEKTLARYKSRSTYNPTPFGLFASIGTGLWSDTNTLKLESNVEKRIRLHARLDMDICCQIGTYLENHPAIKSKLNYALNSTLYKTGAFYKYFEEKNFSDSKRFEFSRINHSKVIERIFNHLKEPQTLNEIKKKLITLDLSDAYAEELIQYLIDEQLIKSEFTPNVTGSFYFDTIINRINSISDDEHILSLKNWLFSIQKKIESVNSISSFNYATYEEIGQLLNEKIKIESFQNLLQVDSLSNLFDHNSLDKSIQKDLLSAVGVLYKLAFPKDNLELEKFKIKFLEHFDKAEVPLLHALDLETGISFGHTQCYEHNTLVSDLLPSQTSTDVFELDDRTRFRLKIVEESLKQNLHTFVIEEHMLKDFEFNEEGLPATFPIVFNILNKEKDLISIGLIGGSSATNLLSRFSYDECFSEIIQTIQEKEDKIGGHCLLSEIAHLSENRVGNISSRNSFRKHEIPILTQDQNPLVKYIPLCDLMLSLNADNELILRSKSLNQKVFPFLSNAHNYNKSEVAIYCFLAEMQFQNIEKFSLEFVWGKLFDNFNFLPRVQYKNMVLIPATWKRVSKDSIGLCFSNNSYEKNVHILEKFLITKHITPIFKAVAANEEHLFNCNSEDSINLFFDFCKKNASFTIKEFLFDMERPFLKDDLGNGYINEFMGLVVNPKSKAFGKELDKKKDILQNRSFNLFDEWFYFKIYCNPIIANTIITEVYQMVRRLFKSEGVDRWFFIRYFDGEHHLRIRLHIKNENKFALIIDSFKKLQNDLNKKYRINRIILEKYIREMERYSFFGIKEVEGLFNNDATSICRLLQTNEKPDDLTLLYCMESINQLLTHFNLTIIEKLKFTEDKFLRFYKEHQADKNVKVMLDKKYRSLKDVIQQFQEGSQNKMHSPIYSILKDKCNTDHVFIKKIQQKTGNTAFNLKTDELLTSLVHMSINRIFNEHQRTYEFLLYHFLSKCYKTKLHFEKEHV